MNAKKGRPAALTSSLLARKGEAQPSRLADGSAPRDVMALHEEIVARLADEIAQEGQDISGAQMGLTPLGAAASPEPRFDFPNEPEIECAPGQGEPEGPATGSAAQGGAPYYQAPLLKDTPSTDDTDFDFEGDGEEAAAPPPSQGGFGELRPSDLRSYSPQADQTSIPAQEVRFEVADVAPPRPAPQSAFVSLRAADAPIEPEEAVHPGPRQKVVASLPMAFAVMVAIAIGGGLGLWVAGSLGSKTPKPSDIAMVSAPASSPAATAVEPAEAPPAPLAVPDAGEISVAPIETPASPRKGAPTAAAPATPAPVAAPKTPEVAAPAVAAATLTGAYGVQLLSTPSESDAVSSWERLAAKMPALAKLPHEVVRADLGAKGIYHRLQAGNFDSQADAKALCKTLAAARQSCIVIKR